MLCYRGGMSEMKESKDDEIESKKAQEVIGLLLRKPDEDSNEALESVNFAPASCKSEIPSITVSIAEAPALNICHVSLTDTGMILESSDILRHSLDASSSIQLEDGTTAFVQNFEPVDDSDSGDATTRFIDGQAVQLEDGTTAFIHAAPREGLQPVQLEDGTMAYLSQSGAELFNGEASTLELDNIATSQLTDPEVKDLDLKVQENYSKTNASRVAEKAFQCEYPNCKRLYTTLHHLKVHERSHTGDRPFKCTLCSKAFATGYGLKSHTRVHTGETPYKCPDDSCQKAFKTSGDLQKHVRTHTGERPFKCPYNGCDRAFTTSNIRKVHIRTHTGERPYICKEEGCGRAFASATNYKNHIRIHTGEKPYLCTVAGCNKRFTEYSSLYKHHVVHTHSKPYSCTLCGKNYRQTSTLAMHKRTAHGILDHNDEEVTVDSALKEKDSESDVQRAEEQENQNNCVNAKQETKDAAPSSGKTTFPTIVALQGDNSSQILQEHSVYAVQIQEDGTLSSNMQPIVLVTDSSQLVALQQFETVLTAVERS